MLNLKYYSYKKITFFIKKKKALYKLEYSDIFEIWNRKSFE